MEAALCQQFTWVCRIFSSSNFSWLRQNWFLNFHQMEKPWCYWCDSSPDSNLVLNGPGKKRKKKSNLDGVFGILIPWHIIQTLWRGVERLRFFPFQPLVFPISGLKSKSPWRTLGFNRFLWHFSPSPWRLAGGIWTGESRKQKHLVSGSISAHPSEELDNAPFLDFRDLLSNIPKFGLSFEILQGTPKHTSSL